jgi:hypothetical protein
MWTGRAASRCYVGDSKAVKDRSSRMCTPTMQPRCVNIHFAGFENVNVVSQSSATLEGIDSVDDFVEKLDRIEPPGQLVALLADPLLQKYVDLKPSPITAARLGNWLATCLEEQFEEHRQGTGDDQYLSEVLDGLLKYAQYTKVSALSISSLRVLMYRSHYILQYLRFFATTSRYGMANKMLLRY